jgi:hypothetical protein
VKAEYDEKDLTKAEELYGTALELNPDHSAAYTNMGIITFYAKKNVTEACMFQALIIILFIIASAHSYVICSAFVPRGDSIGLWKEKLGCSLSLGIFARD